MGTFEDLAGQPFGRLVAHEYVKTSGRGKWRCECQCGAMVMVRPDGLKSGHSQSCGCLAAEARVRNGTRHGMSHSPEYASWEAMIARCESPNNASTKNYAERGITVCDRWRTSFAAFFEDMGPRPFPSASVERENNDLGYSPENCCWADRTTQTRNRRVTLWVDFRGERRRLADLADEFGLPYQRVYLRIYKGWSVERAVTTPITAKAVAS